MSSKLEVAMKKVDLPIKKSDVVLYLGASHGVTPEILAKKVKFVFCLDVAPEVVKELVKVCEKHSNMCPLLFDASKPKEYKDNVAKVNIIYQDLAQKDQVRILIKNSDLFLKKGDYALFCLKIPAIDSIKPEEDTLEKVKKQLSKHFEIIETIDISKTHKGHRFLIIKKLFKTKDVNK